MTTHEPPCNVMTTLRIEDIPDDQIDRLRVLAEKQSTTVDDLIVDAIEREVDRIEFDEELAAKGMLHVKVSPSELIALRRSRRAASKAIE